MIIHTLVIVVPIAKTMPVVPISPIIIPGIAMIISHKEHIRKPDALPETGTVGIVALSETILLVINEERFVQHRKITA